MSAPPVVVRGLDFRYQPGLDLVLRDVSLEVAAGARCLLVGRNGAGKSTLLEILAGRHLVPPDVARVLDRPAFHDTSLSARVSFIGGDFPFDADVRVGDVLAAYHGIDPARRARLVEILEVDLDWRMSRVSTGQRRRVQLVLGLMRPAELLLLDEVMTDLDLLGRIDLLELLRSESEGRGATILLATHVFDRIDTWATDLVHVARGRILRRQTLQAVRSTGEPVLSVVERWLRDPSA